MGRVILHCDCNSFFASVETAMNPEYRGVPMAVCGSVEERHGIVLAKNELAKKYGVQTAETVYSAKRKCPSLVIAKPHYEEYTKYSKRVNAIYARYTDLIEPFGIDESWLDVTASRKLFGTGEEIAERIREEVKREIGITISVGVSFNKAFAKLGSDYKKPDAVTVINEENYQRIVYPLPISDLLFVGRKTEQQLKNMGIRTIGELAATSLEFLVQRFGKMGELLHKYSNGKDDSPVTVPVEGECKSVGNGQTFRRDLLTREEWRAGVDYLSDKIGARLRAIGMRCSTVSVSIRDEKLHSIQRQRPQHPPTDVASEIADTAFSIISDEWREGDPIRTLTVTASNLSKTDTLTEQINFFEDSNSSEHEKNQKRENAMDIIRQKYGGNSITKGNLMASDLGISESEK